MSYDACACLCAIGCYIVMLPVCRWLHRNDDSGDGVLPTFCWLLSPLTLPLAVIVGVVAVALALPYAMVTLDLGWVKRLWDRAP